MFRQAVASLRSSARSIFSRRLIVVFLTLMLLLGNNSPANAEIINIKISGEMPDFGSVYTFLISPDGQYIVFSADRQVDQMIELYSVPITGGEPVRLNGPFPNGGNLQPDDFVISSDSQRVVYLADQDVNDKIELYSVPIGGGSAVKLNGSLVYGGNVVSFLIAADGQRVVFRADQDLNDRFELYCVPITGGTVVKLNGALVDGGDVHAYDITPNSQRVVYSADQEVDSRWELYSVPITGGLLMKLSDPLPRSGMLISNFAITPNSLGVVFNSDPEAENKKELFSNSILGGELHQLSTPTIYTMQVEQFAITPNNAGVVYIADQDTDNIEELYSVYITGGTPVKLSGTLAADTVVSHFTITPNSLGVAWMTRQEAGGSLIYELYSNYTTGGTPIKLNGPLTAGGSVENTDLLLFAITPNSGRVVYLADQDTDEIRELYSNSILGGTPVKLNGVLAAGGYVACFIITPNSQGVIYTSDQDMDTIGELYLNSITGGAPVKLNGPLVENGHVDYCGFKLTPNGNMVVYRADQEVFGKIELYLSMEARLLYLPVIRR